MAQTPLADQQSSGLLVDQERGIGHQLLYFWQLLWRDKSGLLGLTIFLLIIFCAVFAPWVAPHDPLEQNLRYSKTPPFWYEEGTTEFLLGTDSLGRDILSRVIYGARVSLTVGFFGVLIAAGLGMGVGLLAGFVGGRVDSIITGVVNVILGLPYLLFVVFIAAIFGRSLINVILIFGITDSPIFARTTRGEVLRMRQSGYVESATSVGVSQRRILLDHILPNLLGPLITVATFEMSAMIFYEAGLGFLNLSVPPSVPSWGNMLSVGRKYLLTAPWMTIYPALAIMITSLSINLLGDWLRDVLDPRMRRIKK